jgi:hypothetical protein
MEHERHDQVQTSLQDTVTQVAGDWRGRVLKGSVYAL